METGGRLMDTILGEVCVIAATGLTMPINN